MLSICSFLLPVVTCLQTTFHFFFLLLHVCNCRPSIPPDVICLQNAVHLFFSPSLLHVVTHLPNAVLLLVLSMHGCQIACRCTKTAMQRKPQQPQPQATAASAPSDWTVAVLLVISLNLEHAVLIQVLALNVCPLCCCFMHYTA